MVVFFYGREIFREKNSTVQGTIYCYRFIMQNRYLLRELRRYTVP